ncbi:YraN family protein [Kitasatospora purpeofusca]|uniref:YraN family protein n=1 Tax=Kitasatospora purpeofusca TaxID=67352 RepID=UPI0037FC3433
MQDIERATRQQTEKARRDGQSRRRAARAQAGGPLPQADPGSVTPASASTEPAPPVTALPAPAGAGAARLGNTGLGRYGESVAARRLAEEGLHILDRNWRCVEGELDIVALDGDTVAVCEVKTRSERSFQQPSEAIDHIKADRLRRLAERWMSERWPGHFARLAGPEYRPGSTDPPWAPVPPGGVRIDLVAVINRVRGAATVDHLRGVV